MNDVLEMHEDKSFYIAQEYLETLKRHKSSQNSKGNGIGYAIVNEKGMKNPISNALLATGG